MSLEPTHTTRREEGPSAEGCGADGEAHVPARRQRAERKCTFCSRTFSKGEHLARHLRSHTKERPFQCTTCGKYYARQDTLLRHERSHTTNACTNATQDSPSHSTSTSVIAPTETNVNGLDYAYGARPDLHSLSNGLNDRRPIQQTTSPLPQDAAILLGNDAVMFDGQPDLAFPTWSPTDSNAAPWLLSNDFNVFAVDETLNAAISEWAQLPNQPAMAPPLHNVPLTPQTASISALETSENVCMNVTSTASPKKRSARALDAVAKTWFTQLRSVGVSCSTSRAASEAPREQFGVDEQYRDKLTKKMRSRPVGDSLPSVNFLNVCLKAYVSRFHPIFPVIHIPTFRPTSQNAFLLLSMCSIGSLFVGSESVRTQGTEIFWRLNKVILATWDKHLAQGNAEAMSMVQAALLGQTFAMLSGKPEDLFQADMYHGTMLAWARKVQIFKQTQPPLPTEDMDEGVKQDLWHQWLRFEQCNRFALALAIHDSELASLFHHEPLTRESIVGRGRPLASDALFSAPDASICLQALQEQGPERDPIHTSLNAWMEMDPISWNSITDCIADSNFTAYSVLSSLNASILEARYSLTLDDRKIEVLSKGLLSWYQVCERNGSLKKSDNFNMRVLWHAAFIALHADMGALEAAIGRDGHREAEGAAAEARKWISSPGAIRCLLHGLLLQEQVEGMRFGSEPALHVPRALYSAALVWLICSQFAVPGQVRMPNMAAPPFPEIRLIKGASQGRLRDFGVSSGCDLMSLSTGITYGLIDLLQRAGRWGIAESLARTLTAALDAHAE